MNDLISVCSVDASCAGATSPPLSILPITPSTMGAANVSIGLTSKPSFCCSVPEMAFTPGPARLLSRSACVPSFPPMSFPSMLLTKSDGSPAAPSSASAVTCSAPPGAFAFLASMPITNGPPTFNP
jgi:hypothetical protein